MNADSKNPLKTRHYVELAVLLAVFVLSFTAQSRPEAATRQVIVSPAHIVIWLALAAMAVDLCYAVYRFKFPSSK